MGRAVTIELLDEIQDGFDRHDVTAARSHIPDDCEWLMARGPNAPEEDDVSGRLRSAKC